MIYLRRSLSVIVLLALFNSGASAWALPSMGVAVVGAGTLENYNQSTTSRTSLISNHREFGFPGGGLLVDFDLGSFQLQSGLLYLQHKYGNSEFQFDVTEQTIDLPILLRYKIFPMLSIGAGVYAARFVGHQTVFLMNSGTVGNTLVVDEPYPSSMDYGFLLSAALAIPVGFYDVVADGRYAQGLKNLALDPTNNSLKRNEFQFFAGIRLGLGI